MPPKNKKKGATRTIEIVPADVPADLGPATVRFPYTGELEGATKVDIAYTAVVCASLLGCTADHAETIMDVAHLRGAPVVSARLDEPTETQRVRYTEQDGTVYLRATRGQTGAWTLVGKAELFTGP